MNRRDFLKYASVSTTAFSIVPSHVLGAAGQTPPSEKITVALIGCGTEGLRESLDMLALPEAQMVAVCDPNRESRDYIDWSKDGLRSSIGQAIGQPAWRAGAGIPGGRVPGQELVELYYAHKRGQDAYRGCAIYEDYRELLDQAKGVDAVKIMTPDHLHATIAIAAMKAGKHVILHKPLANRVAEARRVIETARQTQVRTHFMPASRGGHLSALMKWVRGGVIGRVREIHNWSNRPVWPQYATLPTDRPAVPKDFNWDLWLGPSLDRPYHPHYTHAVFRGWYEFGGGAVADMGHYSLWQVFAALELDAPIAVESTPSHECAIRDQVSVKIPNDYSFPKASTIRFKFAAKGARPALDLFWYDGGMRPPTPEELEEDNQEFEPEGMLIVGDQGKILAGFLGQNPRIIPARKAKAIQLETLADDDLWSQSATAWVESFKGGARSQGDFTLAGPIAEAFNLGAISLRLGGKRLVWDAPNMKITNVPDANKLLTREYRKGWEIA
jgi:predicted dehydrogenase